MEGGPGEALMKRLRLIRPKLGAASARTAIPAGGPYLVTAAGFLDDRRTRLRRVQNPISL